MNAIERLHEVVPGRTCNCPLGMTYHALNCEVAPGALNEFAALAAVDALHQAAKKVDDLSAGPIRDFDALWSACEELHRCVLRVEAGA